MGDGGRRIVQDPAILSGKPVVNGTRIPVAVVLEYLADNPNFDEFFADYPRLTLEDVKACLAFAHAVVETVSRKKASMTRGDSNRFASHSMLGTSQPLSSEATEAEGAMVNSATLWARVRALEGHSLPTMSGRAMFEITTVNDDNARIMISSGKSCNIERRQFEQAVTLGLVAADITPSELRQAGIENPTYAAGIIRAIARQTSA